MPGHRIACPCCKISVLNRDVGGHILKNHASNLFSDKINIKTLHSDSSLRKPLQIYIPDEGSFYFCMADNSCIRKEGFADKHFKGKADKHKEVILTLREKYPLVSTSSETNAAPSVPVLSPKEIKIIQEGMAGLMNRIRHLERKAAVDEADCYEFDKKQQMAFWKIGIHVDDKSLKKLYPSFFEEPKEEPETHIEEEAPALVEPEEDMLSIAPVKKMTLQDVIRETFTEKDIKNLSTSVTTGQIVEIPELKQMYEVVKTAPAPAPAPIPAPAPVVVPDPVPEAKDFSKMSHWERYKYSNPGMTESELIEGASFLGIRADKGMSPEMAALMYKSASMQRAPEPSFGNLIQNTKTKRAPKVC